VAAVRRKSGRMPQEPNRLPSFPGSISSTSDSLLSDEREAGPQERAPVRGRAGVADHAQHDREGTFSDASGSRNGQARAVWRESEGLRLRGNV